MNTFAYFIASLFFIEDLNNFFEFQVKKKQHLLFIIEILFKKIIVTLKIKIDMI
jgi:hypothetical protein